MMIGLNLTLPLQTIVVIIHGKKNSCAIFK